MFENLQKINISNTISGSAYFDKILDPFETYKGSCVDIGGPHLTPFTTF